MLFQKIIVKNTGHFVARKYGIEIKYDKEMFE